MQSKSNQIKCVARSNTGINFSRYDDKFRQTLVSNVPGAESILKILLQEEGNAIDEATKSIGKATQKVSDFSSSVTGYFGGNKLDEPAPAKRKN